jgi:hypothetical protein
MSTVSELVQSVLGVSNPPAPPDVTGASLLNLPGTGVSLDLVNGLLKKLVLGDASGPDLLPGLAEIPVVIKACRFTDSGVDLDGAIGQWEISFGLDMDSSAIGFSASFPPGASGNPLVLGTLLDRAGLAIDEFHDVTLEQVAVRAVLRDQIYSLDLGVQNLLKFKNFQIVDAELSLFYMGAGDDGDSDLTGSILADAVLLGPPGAPGDPIRFQVSAAYDGPDEGWTFKGSASFHPKDVLQKFGITESPLDDLSVNNMSLSFNTGSEELEFSFEGALDTGNAATNPKLTVKVNLVPNADDSYDKFLSGELAIGGAKFDLVVDQKSKTLAFVGLYQNTSGELLKLADLVNPVFKLPDELNIGLAVKDVLFAFQKNESGKNFLFLADTDASIDLSGLGNLPLIGPAFQSGETVDVSLMALASSQDAEHPFDVPALRALMPAGAPALTDKIPELGMLTTVRFGDLRAEVDIGIERPAQAQAAQGTTAGGASGTGTATATATASSAPAPDATKIQWVKIGKSFGPLAIQQIGLGFESGTITVLLEAALSVGGLTLSVEGLGATYNISSRHADFTLRGIGLDFRQDPVEIGGGFLNLGGDFAGKVVIRTEEFAISALGAFTFIEGDPSMMIYGLLDYPLGGPAFFFIEGLAAGFGYNRSFTLPAIDGVREFPLVQDAIAPQPAKDRLAGKSDKAAIAEQLARLHDFIAPSVGEYFLAIGIKFTSFKLINSFLLLAAAFGKKFELDLIGTSTYQSPPVVPPGLPALAYIELNLLGRFSPDEGVASLEGRLTDKSYIYSNLCQISGGFAFYTWFQGDHAGDFVLSVGGYNPIFRKPNWYPDVPRVELKYQITPEIYVKGSAYFALTPSTFMAGGALDARFESGSLAAWFSLTVDFLICWQPYHYDAHVSVVIGAQWKIFSAEAHADLQIWGPDFSGIADVDWLIFSFTISFGSSNSRSANPIGWPAFKQAFLPSDDKVLNLRIVQGTIGSTAGDLAVVNPAQLTVDIESLVPIKEIVYGSNTQPVNADFGVAPMDLKTVATSSLSIIINRRLAGGKEEDTTGEFDFNPSTFPRTGPIRKNTPKALWGTKFQAGMDQDGTLEAAMGYRFAARTPTDGAAVSMERSDAAFDLSPIRSFAKDDGTVLTYTKSVPTGPDPDRARRAAIRQNLFGSDAKTTQANRTAMLAALGIDAVALGTLNESLVDSFMLAPQIVTPS